MLSDPLAVKTADVITSSLAASNWARIRNGANDSEYRLDAETGNYRDKWILLIGNYSVDKNNPDIRRVVLKETLYRYDTVLDKELPPASMQFSFIFDENSIVDNFATNAVRRLCYLLANTEDDGVVDRIMNGER